MKYFLFLFILSGCSINQDEVNSELALLKLNQPPAEWSTLPEKVIDISCSKVKIECANPKEPGEYSEKENEKTWTIECSCSKAK